MIMIRILVAFTLSFSFALRNARRTLYLQAYLDSPRITDDHELSIGSRDLFFFSFYRTSLLALEVPYIILHYEERIKRV